MVSIKYLGKTDTLIRTEKNGEKVDVKVGGIIDVSQEQADFYTKKGMGFDYVTGEVKKTDKGAVAEANPTPSPGPKKRK